MWCCDDVLGNYVSQNTRPHPNSLSLYTRPYLEKEFFASIIKQRCSRCGEHAEVGPDPKPNGGGPYKRKAGGAARHRGKRERLYEDRGRDWSYAATKLNNT